MTDRLTAKELDRMQRQVDRCRRDRGPPELALAFDLDDAEQLIAAARELAAVREAGPTRWYGRDNSTPPQLWLWEGSRDESAEPIRRVDEKGRMVDSVAAELNSLTAEVARLKAIVVERDREVRRYCEQLAGKERECGELVDLIRRCQQLFPVEQPERGDLPGWVQNIKERVRHVLAGRSRACRQGI